jgi:hypothetical protein
MPNILKVMAAQNFEVQVDNDKIVGCQTSAMVPFLIDQGPDSIT